MKSYEDLLQALSDKERAQLVIDAVKDFKASAEYKDAIIADQYYRRHNVTIEQYEKWLYTVTGKKIKDIYGSNHRTKTHFFRREVVQHASYILGKGITLESPELKDKLGKNIDKQLLKLAKIAMVEGRSFGFWNLDHLEVFGYANTDGHAGFCPLYSEETGELMAGIRFRSKKVKNETITNYTLYEVDGVTELRRINSKDAEIIRAKQHYNKTTVANATEGVISEEFSDYNGKLPIIPLYASDTYESDLNGHREAVDAYDLLKNGLINTLDDASEVFWLVKNNGSMSDVDLAKFLQRLKTNHIANVDSEDGGDVEAHQVQVPHEARTATLELLRADLYEDMMLVDMKSLQASQKTTQELQSAYQAQDEYTDDFENFLYDFMDALFELANIDSEVTFNRNKVVNYGEQTTMVLSAQNVLSQETIIKHIPWLTPEEVQEEIDNIAKEDISRFSDFEEDEPDEEEEAEEGDDE